MKAAILAILLVAASALTVDQSIEMINKIDATPFGHTIFETIFVHLESGDPLDTLMETLGSLEDGYVAD